jgi:hypothetical protein
MNNREETLSDPLIDEVRRRRRELFQELGSDLGNLGKAIEQIQAEHPEKVVDLRKRQSRTTS